MPFELINVGSTYQRIVNHVFSDMLGDSMEAYVDDVLEKSRKDVDHEGDLERAFARMKLHNVRLNPTKCVFGINFGKFIGFMVSQRGIEVNPEKLNTIDERRSPTCHKEVQFLNG